MTNGCARARTGGAARLRPRAPGLGALGLVLLALVPGCRPREGEEEISPWFKVERYGRLLQVGELSLAGEKQEALLRKGLSWHTVVETDSGLFARRVADEHTVLVLSTEPLLFHEGTLAPVRLSRSRCGYLAGGPEGRTLLCIESASGGSGCLQLIVRELDAAGRTLSEAAFDDPRPEGRCLWRRDLAPRLLGYTRERVPVIALATNRDRRRFFSVTRLRPGTPAEELEAAQDPLEAGPPICSRLGLTPGRWLPPSMVAPDAIMPCP